MESNLKTPILKPHLKCHFFHSFKNEITQGSVYRQLAAGAGKVRTFRRSTYSRNRQLLEYLLSVLIHFSLPSSSGPLCPLKKPLHPSLPSSMLRL